MAAEVGLAFLSASLQVFFDRLASPNVVNFIMGKKLDPKLVPRLKTRLYAVGALLDDAENKQIKDDAVKNWLDDVRDAVYEADDLLDELSTKAATRSLKEVSNFFSFLNFQDRDKNMGNKIADIIEQLDELAKQKDALGLKNTVGEKLLHSQRPQSTSLLEVSGTYGRDKDKEAIITLLLSDDMSHSKVGVIPIVGMGGIGKTTLAQLVYNDEKVRQKFDLFAWVCVSEIFDVFNITKTILKAINSGPCDEKDLNSLQLDLKEYLKEKKFFIVLDDAWSENYDDWHPLMTPFGQGSEGSKLIVTTRSTKVASIIQTVPFYPLGHLSDEDCWLIFTKHASPSKNPTLDLYLEKNRRYIINKCKGLPLGAKLLGGLFRSQPDVGRWDIILKNNIWDLSESKTKIMPLPALRISYHYLPSHLKRCFVHCSLFPKDYEFSRDELIFLWMAEDLLQPMDGNMTLKQVGDMYFDDLMSRSFFQHSSSKWDGDYFVMHDLVHDLATFFAGKFYGISKIDQENNIAKETRHMSYNMSSGQIELSFSELSRTKALRTFLHFTPASRLTSVSFENVLNLKCMRVLSLRGFRIRGILLESVCELIHLRYLDLSFTSIRSLPASVGKLHNLQTLKLESCYELTILPSSIQDLVNLRFLDVRFTPLQAMPRGIGKLKNLHYLSNFIVSKDQVTRIEELGDLPNIGGNLCISHLEYVSSGEEASLAKMLQKKQIESIVLEWASNNDMLDSVMERDILGKLQPHNNLRNLCIRGYRGTNWPHWFGLQDMTEITLENCENCYSLPPLGQLPSLKKLVIERFDKMVSIETEFYNSNKSALVTPFPSLKCLRFSSMPAWQEWCLYEMGAFPQLQELSLDDCPKLVGYLPKHLPALTSLEINDCQQLAYGIPKSQLSDQITIDDREGVVLQAEEGAISVKKQTILNCKKLEFPNHVSRESLKSLSIVFNSLLSCFPMDGFFNLEELEIGSCENLESIVVSQSELQSIIIEHKPNLGSLSRGLPALNMTHLTVSHCPKLKSLPLDMDKLLPNLKKLEIRGCPETEWHGDMPPHLTHLTIDHCVFAKFSKKWALPHLIDLKIDGYYDNGSVQCFLEQGLLLPSSLTTLRVQNLHTLDTLECNGFQHLTSLQDLSISECPKLERIAGERMPSSIRELSIGRCPLLEEQCRMKNAEIWPKISHIPTIHTW